MSSKFATSAIRHPAHEEETDSEGTWAISYGDMVTLLLCFFILFFQIRPEEESVTRFQQGLSEKLAQKSIPIEQTGGGGGVPTMSLGKGETPGIDQDLLKRLNGVVHDHGSKIIIEFPGVSFFPSGQTELTPDGRQILQEFVSSYSGFENQHYVGIRAFTDTRPVRAIERRNFKDNLELSALRSISTMRELVKGGIPMAMIRLGGFGELKLTAKELEKYLLEREKDRIKSDADAFVKEVQRLERVIASHHKHPMAGTRKAPKLSQKQQNIILLAEQKIRKANEQRTSLLSTKGALGQKDQNFLRDKLARTVVLVIEPKGEQ